MKIVAEIPWRGRLVKINPDKSPVDERQLIGFLRWNNAPACFVKTDNAWRKITKEGDLLYVSRTLYLLTLKEWLNIALDDKFTGYC
jgi:hypothetical protein